MLAELVNSKAKAKILNFLALNQSKSFTPSEISRFCNLSKSRASELLREFEKKQAVSKKNIGKSIVYTLLQNNKIKILIELFKKDSLSTDEIINEFIGKYKKQFSSSLVSAILFGSYARGTAREDSDINLLIIVDEKEKQIKQNFINNLTTEFLVKYKKRFSPILISQEEIEKKAYWPNPIFYGILLSYTILYDKQKFFEKILEIVKMQIKDKKPIYVEGGKKWELAKMI